MTSKEIIINQIDTLKEQAKIEKELKTGSEIYCEIEIEQYNQVLKDLEILDIIKKWFMESITDYRDYDKTLFVDHFIREDEPIFKILREWLDEGQY